jgi:phospholipase A-2-activating protein
MSVAPKYYDGDSIF